MVLTAVRRARQQQYCPTLSSGIRRPFVQESVVLVLGVRAYALLEVLMLRVPPSLFGPQGLISDLGSYPILYLAR